MACYEIRNLNFSYPGSEENALSGISLAIGQGEFVAVIGPSGCGKSTLLRHLKPVLAPHGKKSGEIFFNDVTIDDLSRREQSARIGFVSQSPDNQTVTDKVWHELAFGLESLGYDTPSIRRRVAEMASFFGIQTWFHKDVSELSGGQKQLLNLASVMAMQPSVLILDEPTSQTDPIASADFLAAIGKINRELGTTVIITEHRLEEVLPIADRVIVLDEGRVICDGTPAHIGEMLKNERHGMFLSMPTPMRVCSALSVGSDCPITVREGRNWLEAYSTTHRIGMLPEEKDCSPEGKPLVVELDSVWFRYEKNAQDVIKGLSLKAYGGELLAILGGNGTGKTTALSLIAGLNKPYRGKVKYHGQTMDAKRDLYDGFLGVLPQNPQSIFVKKTVREDLLEMLSAKKLTREETERKVDGVAKRCRIEGILSRHPYDLSGGEQQRAALAKVLLTEPQILLLDEPTKGFDGEFKRDFAQILYELINDGATIIMVSHDVEFCAKYAQRCALFFDGSIAAEGSPREFFSGNSFYTTAASRMARELVPGAVTAEDIIAAFGGDIRPFEPKLRERRPVKPEPADSGSITSVLKEKRVLTKRTLAAMAMILIAVPLTLLIGERFMGDRKYYFISMLILLETMLPFVMVFESRKPKARELIIISVLCAIAVAGRAAFIMVPQFKPVIAIVIIAGVAFGGEAGFLVGAITAFVSNFFFGQGPWTPWQMFSFGIIGFLAGVLFRKGFLSSDRLSLCVYGGFAVLFIHGGITNPASVIMFQGSVSWEMILAAYIAGFPMDLLHAAATVIFLFFISRPFLEKLERIKTKYGLIE